MGGGEWRWSDNIRGRDRHLMSKHLHPATTSNFPSSLFLSPASLTSGDSISSLIMVLATHAFKVCTLLSAMTLADAQTEFAVDMTCNNVS